MKHRVMQTIQGWKTLPPLTKPRQNFLPQSICSSSILSIASCCIRQAGQNPCCCTKRTCPCRQACIVLCMTKHRRKNTPFRGATEKSSARELHKRPPAVEPMPLRDGKRSSRHSPEKLTEPFQKSRNLRFSVANLAMRGYHRAFVTICTAEPRHVLRG